MKISKFLKITMVMSLCVISLCFTGCAVVNAGTIINLDGSIDEVVAVSLNLEALAEQNYTEQQIEALKTDISRTAKQEAESIKQKFLLDIEWNIVNTTDADTIQTLTEYKSGLNIIYDTWEENTYRIGLKFKDRDVYRYHYQIPENSNVKMHTEKHFLHTKVYYYSLTMYAKHQALYSELNAEFSLKYPKFINNENNQLIFTYVTEFHREHSNAQFISQGSDGNYYHSWVVDPEDVTKPIMIYYNVANTEVWIALCVAVALIACGIFLIVGVILQKTRKESKANQTDQTQ